MTSYNFQPRFIRPILAGDKTQTIRAPRLRHHVYPDGQMQLYTAQRTRHVRKIGDAIAHTVEPITLDFSTYDAAVSIAGDTRRDPAWLDRFARADGFADWQEMRRFWRIQHGEQLVTFSGVLIRWRSFTPGRLFRASLEASPGSSADPAPTAGSTPRPRPER